jgi:hypothetical protein
MLSWIWAKSVSSSLPRTGRTSRSGVVDQEVDGQLLRLEETPDCAAMRRRQIDRKRARPRRGEGIRRAASAVAIPCGEDESHPSTRGFANSWRMPRRPPVTSAVSAMLRITRRAFGPTAWKNPRDVYFQKSQDTSLRISRHAIASSRAGGKPPGTPLLRRIPRGAAPARGHTPPRIPARCVERPRGARGSGRTCCWTG